MRRHQCNRLVQQSVTKIRERDKVIEMQKKSVKMGHIRQHKTHLKNKLWGTRNLKFSGWEILIRAHSVQIHRFEKFSTWHEMDSLFVIFLSIYWCCWGNKYRHIQGKGLPTWPSNPFHSSPVCPGRLTILVQMGDAQPVKGTEITEIQIYYDKLFPFSPSSIKDHKKDYL